MVVVVVDVSAELLAVLWWLLLLLLWLLLLLALWLMLDDDDDVWLACSRLGVLRLLRRTVSATFQKGEHTRISTIWVFSNIGT